MNSRTDLGPDDRAKCREIFDQPAMRRLVAALIGLRPQIGGADDQSALASARIAQGYELCVSTLSRLLTDPPTGAEIKQIPIRED
jgi:hypothetical protein